MQARCQPIAARGDALASRLLPLAGMAAWSFVTLVLAALALGAPLAHALEMPVRRAYEPALYVMVTHTLYAHFGTVGAAFEVGAVVAAVILPR